MSSSIMANLAMRNQNRLAVTAGVLLVGKWLFNIVKSKFSGENPKYAGMSGVVPFSARKIAAWRALESELGQEALFIDKLAADLAGPEALAAAKAMRDKSSAMPSRLAIRTKFFDDALVSALESLKKPPQDSSIMGMLERTFSFEAKPKVLPQVVLLGSGMDTRIFRLKSTLTSDEGKLGEVAFELDLAEVLNAKEEVLQGSGQDGEIPPLTLVNRRVAVGADLNDGESWERTLIESGFNPEVPTVWLSEGLVMYLNPESVDDLVSRMYKLSAPKSVLLVSMVNQKAVEKAQKSSGALMQTWKWGSDTPGHYFESSGWSSVEVVQIGEEKANYGRYTNKVPSWEDKDATRTLYVRAERK